MNDDERLLNIRRTHASAKPKRENWPWFSTHKDLAFVLARLDHTERLLKQALSEQIDAQSEADNNQMPQETSADQCRMCGVRSESARELNRMRKNCR